MLHLKKRRLIIDDRPTPGDAQLFLQLERTLLACQQKIDSNPEIERVQALTDAIDHVDVSIQWQLLNFVPEWRATLQQPFVVYRFNKLKKSLRHSVRQNGVNAFDDEKLFLLELFVTQIEFGQWLNRESRKLLTDALDAQVFTRKTLRAALTSFGAMVDGDGRLHAIPVRKLTGLFLILMTILVVVIQAVCVSTFVNEMIRPICQSCVIFGATVVFALCLQAHQILYQIGINRARGASVLISAGISSFADRRLQNPFDFIKLFRVKTPKFSRKPDHQR